MRMLTVAGLAGLAVIALSACQKANSGAASSPGGTVTVGGDSVDLGKLVGQAAGNLNAVQGRKTAPAVDPQKLKALLPGSVAGLPRTQFKVTSVGANGGMASSAEAVYGANGASQITITIVDLAAAQGLTAMVMSLNASSDTETATGYDKQSTINGRMTTESWDRQSKGGKFGVVVANRFSVEASGNANSIDVLKAAVAAVGPDRLEGLARG